MKVIVILKWYNIYICEIVNDLLVSYVSIISDVIINKN